MLRSFQKLLVFLFMLIRAATLLFAVGYALPSHSAASEHIPNPSSEQVNHAITLATDYLVRACGPDGKFVYKVDVYSGASTLPRRSFFGIMKAHGIVRWKMTIAAAARTRHRIL
jgi:hypothetical protein